MRIMTRQMMMSVSNDDDENNDYKNNDDKQNSSETRVPRTRHARAGIVVPDRRKSVGPSGFVRISATLSSVDTCSR